MPSYDPTRAECFVFTFKEGLLSSVAHDLRIAVTRFVIEVEGAGVTARFDTDSLRVDAPMKNGVEDPGALSASDKDKIAAQIREEVLHSRRFPHATFRSTSMAPRVDGGYDLTGDLTLHGVTRRVQAQSRLLEGRQEVELSLHQPDFGIAPYKAMLGALKVHPDVKVRVRL
jgi:YceI-like domain